MSLVRVDRRRELRHELWDKVFAPRIEALYKSRRPEAVLRARILSEELKRLWPEVGAEMAHWTVMPAGASRASARVESPRSNAEGVTERGTSLTSRTRESGSNQGGSKGGAHAVDETIWLPLLNRSGLKLQQGSPKMGLPYWRRARDAALKLLRAGYAVDELEAAVTKAVELRRRDRFAGYNNLVYIWGSGFQVIMAERRALAIIGGPQFRETTEGFSSLSPEEAAMMTAQLKGTDR